MSAQTITSDSLGTPDKTKRKATITPDSLSTPEKSKRKAGNGNATPKKKAKALAVVTPMQEYITTAKSLTMGGNNVHCLVVSDITAIISEDGEQLKCATVMLQSGEFISLCLSGSAHSSAELYTNIVYWTAVTLKNVSATRTLSYNVMFGHGKREKSLEYLEVLGPDDITKTAKGIGMHGKKPPNFDGLLKDGHNLQLVGAITQVTAEPHMCSKDGVFVRLAKMVMTGGEQHELHFSGFWAKHDWVGGLESENQLVWLQNVKNNGGSLELNDSSGIHFAPPSWDPKGNYPTLKVKKDTVCVMQDVFSLFENESTCFGAVAGLSEESNTVPVRMVARGDVLEVADRKVDVLDFSHIQVCNLCLTFFCSSLGVGCCDGKKR